MGLRDEIRDQPAVVRRLLGEGRAPIARIADRLRGAPIDTIVVAARGTSDHAAVYAQYVFGVRHRLLVALAAPSVTSLYESEPRFGRSVVVGISQSGASPDIVGVVAAARRQGVPTIAITNTAGSPLARAAEHTIDLLAGPERAIAATKTYTAQLTAIALLSAALAESDDDLAALDGVPAALDAALETEADAERFAKGRVEISGCVVLGRGYEYATAREWALKLKELARVLADPYSSADFQHGPLTLLEPGFPVLAVVPSGPPAADLIELLRRIRDDHGVELLVISDRDDARALGSGLALPSGVPDWLMPIVSIVPAQLFAYHLARARGLNPDAPRNIRKVTLTR
ncbi:MAG: SIS domain-containing protein [Chloroflexota bacterium]|nr:SIS domain-containing protein [Chloroflexota bacterium]